MPMGYEDDLVDLRFTQAELDMLYFSCLHDIGHPQAQEFELKDSGFETLLGALTKIQEWMESLELDGEPTVLVTNTTTLSADD
jgi:hypothetical protein